MQRGDVVALISKIRSEGWREAKASTEKSYSTAKGGFVSHVVISLGVELMEDERKPPELSQGRFLVGVTYGGLMGFT